ncbi:RTA1 domain-containingprotein [Purpureocillium lavendulum]|uniref:RTA1 domain-containingprotein n=1 Tax=Purpureocillium lavendulum TaxID=1247861 RepID=A0AB34G7J7_9HYPO|nr:RTA1 domain-containingprotein [Purpureocillium lavendulum]
MDRTPIMSGNSTGARMKTCTEVTFGCPVQATVLGYYPNLGSGIFFTIAFAICLFAAAGLGAWKRTWTYGAAITVGLILETAGYVGRILLHYNPWNNGAFELQICAIILAPTFICVSVYLTLKHVALHLGPAHLSRVPAAWYPRIFLPADLTCLIVQAIGGGIAAAAGHDNQSLQRSGNRAIIAGVALQVVVLAAFGLMGADYWRRALRHVRSGAASPQTLALWNDAKFRQFVWGVTAAYIAILIRCVYRIVEMSGGWGNHIMQDEPSFLVLDSTLVLVAVYLLTIFHPGLFFPQMRNGYAKEMAARAGGAAGSAGGSVANAERDAESDETKNEVPGSAGGEGQKVERPA